MRRLLAKLVILPNTASNTFAVSRPGRRGLAVVVCLFDALVVLFSPDIVDEATGRLLAGVVVLSAASIISFTVKVVGSVADGVVASGIGFVFVSTGIIVPADGDVTYVPVVRSVTKSIISVAGGVECTEVVDSVSGILSVIRGSGWIDEGPFSVVELVCSRPGTVLLETGILSEVCTTLSVNAVVSSL